MAFGLEPAAKASEAAGKASEAADTASKVSGRALGEREINTKKRTGFPISSDGMGYRPS